MLGNDRSHGLWEKTAPPPAACIPLVGPVRTDVAIIGGGYTGLSAALHLAEAGVDATVLEAVEPGFGGAGRNVGLVNAGMWIMPDQLPALLGPLHGERLLDLLGDGPAQVFALVERHGIDCEAVRQGTLHCAVGRQGLAEIRQRHEQWARRGAPVRLLDAEETRARTGSAAYSGALLDARAGTIQPLAYARGLARAALAAGARIFTDSPVIDAQAQGGQWKLSTGWGSLMADRVIVATDAYGSGPWSQLRAEQVHLPYFNIATTPLPAAIRQTILPGREGAWDTKQVLSSFRLDRAGRMVLGSVGALRGTGAAIHRAWARRALHRMFPQIGAIGFEAEWYGQIGMTTDNLPRFHRFAGNVISFSGYNGRGIAPGTVFGKLAAGLMLGTLSDGDLPLPPSPLTRPPLARAQEAFYEAGAQIVHAVSARW
ncbi:NAD(P)/FAD-dependent oxidoreductase [Niveispirillum sp. KHB5.9]|uniref:NAD(P)/FAD-dependent oxidoreductase n=1 Tax=Niveispirillum sp. KHB5.9 TaxID=3400269 RepID=UPI003A874987